MSPQYSLRWKNYPNQITDAFGFLRSQEDLVDVTLSCEGKKIKAHKILLSACSPYFQDIFKENPCKHPVIVFRNVKFDDLLAIIDFMYKGEVNVMQEQLGSFLSTADLLEVKGLSEECGKGSEQQDGSEHTVNEEHQLTSTPDPFIQSLSSETRKEPVVPFLPATSERSSPPLKKRKYSIPSSQLKHGNNEKPVSQLPNPSTFLKIENEEIVEDLTCDDDEDESISCPVSTDDAIQNFQSESSKNFMADPISLDENHDGSVNLDEMLADGPGTMTEGISHASLQATKSIEEENTALKDTKQIPTDGESKLKSKVKDIIVEKSKEKLKDNLKSKSVEQNESENKITDSHVIDSKSSPQKMTKGNLHIPQCLMVSIVSTNKEQIEDTSGNPENVLYSEDDAILRSEEAKTPFQEESSCDEYQTLEVSHVSGLLHENDSEMAAEAPMIEEEEKIEEELVEDVVEEEKEPEFDYYGCQTCKADAKPISDQFNFTHKCPICPCLCFCSHLLKEHMRQIHGWFNVKRSFTQY